MQEKELSAFARRAIDVVSVFVQFDEQFSCKSSFLKLFFETQLANIS